MRIKSLLFLLGLYGAAWAAGTMDKSTDAMPPATVASAGAVASAAPEAAEQRWVTVSSGERHGMYYWFATVLGGVVSAPQGGLPCTQEKDCGVAGSVLLNLSSQGSLDNLERLRTGQTQTGFAQSNLAYAAYKGQGVFDGRGNDKLRAMASFYPEVLHLVVAADSGITKIEDLAGKRLAVGSPQSGTLGSAQALLAAYGIEDVQTETLNVDESVRRFLQGEVDVVFFFSAAGNPVVKNIAAQKPIRLLPLRGDVVKQLVRDNSYYQAASIPAGSYDAQDADVEGIAVQALWLASAEVDEQLVYELTKAAWEGGDHLAWLRDAMPRGAWDVEHALKGIGIPLHPGAKKYYNEIGKRY